MPTLADARILLDRHFGFADFRPAQRDVVRAVLERKDTLAVLPTGAGKSACFQVPALLLDGVTIVVSPLISLMSDQVAACRRRGIAAAALTSATSAVERVVVVEALRARTLRLLYLSPERLTASAAMLRQQLGVPALLAVDEAHCISEWGPDFRPAYRQLGIARRVLGQPPVAALTGSATPAVRRDITRQLNFRTGTHATELVASFDRPNLKFGVRAVASESDRLKAVLAELDGSDPLAIVYTPTRSITESLTRVLRQSGFDAVPYHAGLTNEYRLQALERFTAARLRVVVATCAFGMGIDAPNVRLVVHWSMPPTLESYYQEAGRAGRDGAPARCVLLYRKGDDARQREQLDVTFPPQRALERLWRDPEAARRAPASLQASADRLRAEVVRESGRLEWGAVRQRRRLAEQRIDSVKRYATTRSCRRSILLGYFGERSIKCSGCDQCLSNGVAVSNPAR
jgi:ATP-dependent DNA helicase RecQ